MNTRYKEAEERLESTSAEIAALRNELELRRAEVNKFDIERAALTEKKAALSREIQAIGERREMLAQAGLSILHEIEVTEKESLQAGLRKSEIIPELESLDADFTGLRSLKEEKEKEYNDRRARRSEVEKQLQNLRNRQADMTKKESALTPRARRGRPADKVDCRPPLGRILYHRRGYSGAGIRPGLRHRTGTAHS